MDDGGRARPEVADWTRLTVTLSLRVYSRSSLSHAGYGKLALRAEAWSSVTARAVPDEIPRSRSLEMARDCTRLHEIAQTALGVLQVDS